MLSDRSDRSSNYYKNLNYTKNEQVTVKNQIQVKNLELVIQNFLKNVKIILNFKKNNRNLAAKTMINILGFNDEIGWVLFSKYKKKKKNY